MSKALNDRLRLYLRAEAAILNGAQRYQIGNRMVEKADLRYIQEEIVRLRGLGATEDDDLGGTRRDRARRIVFMD